MSKAIEWRPSSHTGCNKTRCRIEGSEDSGVTYLTTLTQEQSRKQLVDHHVSPPVSHFAGWS